MTRALFLASSTQFAACVINSWIRTGNSVAGVWCAAGDPALRPRFSISGLLFPRFDFLRLRNSQHIRVREIEACQWSALVEEAQTLQPDAIISVMFMKRIPAALLDAFPGRVVNLHPALLPFYRGPAPITGMLEDGTADQYGGVTLHLVSEGFDDGPVVARRGCPRSLARNDFEWRLQVADAAARLAVVELPAYLRREIQAEPQPEGTGSYRRLGERETHLGPFLTLAAVETRLRNFGAHNVHRWVGASGQVTSVTGLSAVLGARTNGPDRRGLLSIEVDLADCRVRLRRRTVLFQLRRNIARLFALYRASYPYKE